MSKIPPTKKHYQKNSRQHYSIRLRISGNLSQADEKFDDHRSNGAPPVAQKHDQIAYGDRVLPTKTL